MCAHPYLIDVWQTDLGLPQNSVTTVVQSRDGYLWLGTFNGLVRFDGVRFKIFDSGNTPELGSSRILKLFEDRRGVLWIGTETGGLSSYDRGEFKNYTTRDGLPGMQINAIGEDHEGHLWIGTVSNGLSRFQNGQFTTFDQKDGLSSGSVIALMQDKNGELLVQTDTTVSVWREGRFLRWSPGGSASFPVDKMVVCRDGGWWIAQTGTLKKWEDGKWTRAFSSEPWQQYFVTFLFEDSRQNIWLGTIGDGLYCYPADGSSRRHFSTGEGLSHAWIRCMYEDQEGSLWIGTGGGGLNRLKQKTFTMFHPDDEFSKIAILSVFADHSDQVWAGAEGGGLYRLQDGRLIRYAKEEGLVNPFVWSVFEDSRKNLWAGTWGGGLFRKEGEQFVPFTGASNIPATIVAMHEDRKGILWLGTGSGLGRLENNDFQLYSTAQGLSHNDVRAVIEDRDGTLWIGTNGGGLNRFKDGKFTRLGRADGLSHDSVWSLYADADGVLWIGTFGGGLNRYYAGKFQSFTTSSGLPDNVICHIAEDSEQHLWLSSYRGVFRVSKSELEDFAAQRIRSINCIRFSVADGLADRQCSGGFQPAGAKTQDGRLWFPNAKGLAVVDPEHLQTNLQPPPVLIEEILIDGMKVPSGPRVHLEPGKRRVEFFYTALSFAAPEHVRFKYQLEGVDGDWVDAGVARQASYTTLPPGQYRFRVIACNNSGVWNETGASVGLNVIPPFWRTSWFLTLVALGAIAVIAGTARHLSTKRMQRKLDQLKEQHTIEKERARIAKDIHDDLGASLTQITLLSELARTDLTKPADAEQHIRQISAMARDLTRSMDEIVWAIDPRNDTLDSLITYICKFSQDYLPLAGIRCRLDVPTALPAYPLSTEVRHNLFLACKESLTNIVKHAHATEVWIRLSIQPSSFVLSIEDNGCGFKLEANGLPRPGGVFSSRGNGLPNLKKRFQEIGGRFELESQPDRGTRTRMVINIKPK
ncbi:MAG: two-component regulator propeller domain-containing protein [Verrucomicrobiota bacterium]